MATLPELRAVFQKAINSPLSSFYKEFYAGKITITKTFPNSIAEWESIPPLTKADIVRTPYYQRLFVPQSAIEMVRPSSGTTGSGIVTIPRANPPQVPALLSLAPAERAMGYLNSNILKIWTPPSNAVVAWDPARPDISAALAAHMQVESLAAPASQLLAFAPTLSKRYDLALIKFIVLVGDACTQLQKASLQQHYPNAAIKTAYAFVESQGCASYSSKEDPNVLEANPYAHIEVVDDELIFTTLHESMAFPLLRYRTGDKATIVEQTSERTLFTVEGRAASDRVRIGDGTLVAAEIERAISASTKGAVTNFEAVVGEERAANGLRATLTITLVASNQSMHLDTKQLARELEHELHITERRTYAEGIERGICAPIVCTLVPKEYALGRKLRPLVDRR